MLASGAALPGRGAATPLAQVNNNNFAARAKYEDGGHGAFDQLRSQAMQTIQSRIASRKLRMNEFFVQYDRLHNRRITESQFIRGIAQAGIQLTPEQCRALADKYTVSVSPSQVDYYTFCNDAHGALLGVEKQPLFDETTVPEPTALCLKPTALSDVENERLEKNIFPLLRQMVREKRVVLRDCFTDYDSHHCGSITQNRFRRSFPISLPPADLDIIVRKYADGGRHGDINYRLLHEDVMEGFSFRPESPPHASRSDVRTLTAAETELREAIHRRRLSLYEFFQDFDPLRSGFVTVNCFKRVICQSGLEHLSHLLDSIARVHVDERKPGFVNYANFCHWIETAAQEFPSKIQVMINRIRRDLMARGGKGLVGLDRAFRRADSTGEGKLGHRDFKECFRLCGVQLSADETYAVFDWLDSANTGFVKYNDVIAALEGVLTPPRRAIVKSLFARMDTRGIGRVPLSVICDSYNAKGHPGHVAGVLSLAECSEDAAYGVITDDNGYVDLESLCRWVALITCAIEADNVFEEVLYGMFS